MSDNPLRPLIEYNADLVDRYYPNLRMSDRWEWNHKVAYLCWLDTRMVGQKSTNPTSPISEDTIGIMPAPIQGGELGDNYYPANFEAVDLVVGTSGERQWLSYGPVVQNFVIPTVADVSRIPESPLPEPEPEPEPDSVAWAAYWGDENSDEMTRTLFYDYSRRPENYNPGMGRWMSRLVHTAYMGPIPPSQGGMPLGPGQALARHRPEWCAALGGLDPNVPVPDDFFPEYNRS